MGEMKVRVHIEVMPKQGLLDPQGKTVEDNLPTLGFSGVEGVRIGKHITLTITGQDEASIRQQIEQMSEQLLSNPVIEDFSYRIEA
jgi:phosphoribosylformylglycinamidine synthase subunit PurS